MPVSASRSLEVRTAAGALIARLVAPLQSVSADAARSAITVLYFAVSLLYGILAERFWRGQTVGKRLLGLSPPLLPCLSAASPR